MERADWKPVLELATAEALDWLESLPERRVRADRTPAEMLAELEGPLDHEGRDPAQVVAELVAAVGPGLTAMPAGRFFGWVIGGALPSAVAADWLVSAWDQNAGMAELSPGTVALEQIAASWLLDVLRLPKRSSVGFVTGAQAANTVGLAMGRHATLAAHGWDVERHGLHGAPRLNVLVGRDVHSTIPRSMRVLGLGADTATEVETDDQGRMRADALAAALVGLTGPTIVCVGAGNVNTGAFDPIAGIVDAVEAHTEATSQPRLGTWVHVDGAFGLWAAASRGHRHLTVGIERADSWTTDAHKWLNTPYDCGIAISRHPHVHRAAMGARADYIPAGDDVLVHEPLDHNLEFSRRARGVPVYAALRQLGGRGVEALVNRTCEHAVAFADALKREPGIEVLNDVVLNQVLVAFLDPRGVDDEVHTDLVLSRVKDEGTCFMSGATWRGRRVMRISVSNWSTDAHDVERSVASILQAHRATPVL